jgi:uncharacterized protein YegJ (DUF2314 family)
MTTKKIDDDHYDMANAWCGWARATFTLERDRDMKRAQVLAAIHDGDEVEARWLTRELTRAAWAYEYVNNLPPVGN